MQYAYQAIGQGGKRARGSVEAENQHDALIKLRAQGLVAMHLNEQRNGAQMTSRNLWHKLRETEIHLPGRAVRLRDFATFCRQFATLIRAGIQIAEAINLLAQQSESRALAAALAKVSMEVRQGSSLWSAVGQQPKIFPPLFVNLVKAGEESGSLDQILERAATFFEKQYYSGEKMKSAMTYPIVIGLMSVAVMVFLMVRIVPTFVSTFASMHATLPLPTRMVIGASHFLVHAWYLLLVAIILIYFLYRWLLRYDDILIFRDTIKLKMPIFGQVSRKSAIARVTRTLSTLYSSSLPILDALDLTAGAAGNAVISRVLRDARTSLRDGKRLSEPISKHWAFPPLVAHMMHVGEETGSLDIMLAKVADFYEAESEALVERMKSLVEPLMIVFLAVIVGIIVTSVILPIYDIYQNTNQMS